MPRFRQISRSGPLPSKSQVPYQRLGGGSKPSKPNKVVSTGRKIVNKVKGMFTNKKDYVDTSLNMAARPEGFKSSIGVVNNAGKYNNRSNRSAPSKTSLQQTVKRYVAKDTLSKSMKRYADSQKKTSTKPRQDMV